MAYEVAGFIGRYGDLRSWKESIPSVLLSRLGCDLGFVPLTLDLSEDLWARVQQSPQDPANDEAANSGVAESELPGAAVCAWAVETSRMSPVIFMDALILTELGGAVCTVWHGGLVVGTGLLPGEALELLGIKRDDPRDEFDTVGLGEHRKTAAWAASAILEDTLGQTRDQLGALGKLIRYRCRDREVQDRVHEGAAESLGGRGPAAVPVLVNCMSTPDASTRAWVACALGRAARLGGADQAVPCLTQAVKDGRGHLRWAATVALGEIGRRARSAIPELIDALRDEDVMVRAASAEALGRMGRAAKAAIPALTRAVGDEDPGVSRDARMALGAIRNRVDDIFDALGKWTRSVLTALRPLLPARFTSKFEMTLHVRFACELSFEEVARRLNAVGRLDSARPWHCYVHHHKDWDPCYRSIFFSDGTNLYMRDETTEVKAGIRDPSGHKFTAFVTISSASFLGVGGRFQWRILKKWFIQEILPAIGATEVSFEEQGDHYEYR